MYRFSFSFSLHIISMCVYVHVCRPESYREDIATAEKIPEGDRQHCILTV